MPPSMRELLKVRINSIQSAIDRNRGGKNDSVSVALATNYNSIVKDAAEAFPDIASSLPEPIMMMGVFLEAGLTEARLVDLDAFCDQILGLLALVEDA